MGHFSRFLFQGYNSNDFLLTTIFFISLSLHSLHEWGGNVSLDDDNRLVK